MANDVIYRGKVTRVDDAGGVFVEVPSLGYDMEFGPLEVVADYELMAAGVRVMVATASEELGDLVILGSVDPVGTPATPLDGLAVDADVVHKAGAETITGTKAFGDVPGAVGRPQSAHTDADGSIWDLLGTGDGRLGTRRWGVDGLSTRDAVPYSQLIPTAPVNGEIQWSATLRALRMWDSGAWVPASVPSIRLVATSNVMVSGNAQTIDGVLANSGIILLTAQTNPVENGPWQIAAGAWTRPVGLDTARALNQCAPVTTYDGTLLKGTVWRMAIATTGVVGTNPITVTQLAVVPPVDPLEGVWQAPTMGAGWVNYGSTWETSGYMRKSGWVSLRGLIKSGTITSGTVIYTLPAGFRPNSDKHFAVTSNGAHAVINVLANGQVKCNVGISASWVSLAGVTFPADQ